MKIKRIQYQALENSVQYWKSQCHDLRGQLREKDETIRRLEHIIEGHQKTVRQMFDRLLAEEGA